MSSTVAPNTGEGLASRKLRRCLPYLALLLALAAVALLAVGPLGWRLGWWHFRFGFSLMPWAGYCGLAAVAVAILALVFGRRLDNRRPLAVGVLAFAVGGLITYVPWHYDHMRGTVPPIHDITTDWDNPPQFEAVLPLRAADNANPVTYEGAKVSDLQRKFFPDIAPVILDRAPRDAFAEALATAEKLGWTIVAGDPATGRIEASQRSRWFGFTDDIAIRVTGQGTGSRVDVRSESRYGRGDFGVNATRVRTYLAALREAARDK